MFENTFLFFCILLFLFVSCAMDKQRDTVMLVLQFYIKKGYTQKNKRKGGKEAYYNVNINRSLHTSSQNIN